MLTSEEFVSILHHNLDCACTYSEGSGDKKDWKEFGVLSGSKIGETLDKGKNNYVSVNNYSKSIVGKRYGCRAKENLLSYNGLFIDIDCHSEPFSAIITDSVVSLVMQMVSESPLKGFTMCCKTGRGLAFYYLYDEVLDAKCEDKVALHNETYDKAFLAFEHLLRFVPHVKVDRSVGDSSRVCRIPGTYNTKAKQNAVCVEYNQENAYSLEEMALVFSEESFGVASFARDENDRIEEQEVEDSVSQPSLGAIEMDIEFVRSNGSRKISRITADNICSQCNVIAKLARMRGMVDGQRRHNAVFIFYCNQKEMCGDDVQLARDNTHALNESFASPLSWKDMQRIFKSVDNHKERTSIHGDGYFIFKRETISKWLQMTAAEERATGIFKNKEKKLKTKANKVKKANDEEKIRELLEQGRTYEEIKKATGRSNGFIARVSKEMASNFAVLQGEAPVVVSSHSNLEHNIGELRECTRINSKEKPFSKEKAFRKSAKRESAKVESAKVESANGVVCVNFDKAYKYSEQKAIKDRELRDAIETLMSGRNAYICGKGGTGKSLVSKIFIKKMESSGKKVLVAAPSGLAAFSIGGSTIHSILKMNANKVYQKGEKPSEKSVAVLKDADCLLVDECGMLRIDHFSYLTSCIKLVEKRYGKRVQLVIVGDFLQLPPVVTSKEREGLERAYGKKMLYQAYEDKDSWNKHGFKVCCLRKNRRQVSDEFANMMDLVRVGNAIATSYFRRFEREDAYYLEDGYIHLCAYKKDANKINAHIVNNHKNDKSYKEFVATLKGGYWTEKNSHMKSEAFYVGMPVMAVVNTERGFKNGSMGTVTKVCGKSVMVRFLGMDRDVRVGILTFEEGGATIKQIPLVPAYAVTIHKCQSQTFDKVVVHQGMFEEGQAYVALSRVRTPEGLVICGRLKEDDIKRPALERISQNSNLNGYELGAIFG